MSETAYPVTGEKWDASIKDPQVLPTLNVADENLAEYSAKYSDLSTYVEQMVVRFIAGEESL